MKVKACVSLGRIKSLSVYRRQWRGVDDSPTGHLRVLAEGQREASGCSKRVGKSLQVKEVSSASNVLACKPENLSMVSRTHVKSDRHCDMCL